MDLRTRLRRMYGPAPGVSNNFSDRPGPGLQPHQLADFLGGRWKERACGQVLCVQNEFSSTDRHGHLPLQALYAARSEVVVHLAGHPSFQSFHPEATLFLDTETTGIAGGTGTYVFLVGMGYFEGERFCTQQFFLPDLNSEKAFLEEINETVLGAKGTPRFTSLVTFNGRSYDVNLLDYRYVLNRQKNGFESLSHLDLLYPCRLLWKGYFGDCRLRLECRMEGKRWSRNQKPTKS